MSHINCSAIPQTKELEAYRQVQTRSFQLKGHILGFRLYTVVRNCPQMGTFYPSVQYLQATEGKLNDKENLLYMEMLSGISLPMARQHIVRKIEPKGERWLQRSV